MFELSEGLQRVRDSGKIPAAESLLRDVWASLYKMKPKILEQGVPESLKPNRTLLGKWMDHEWFDRYRDFTRLDDLTATVCTVSFGEKLNAFLADLKEQDEQIQQQIETVQALQDQLPLNWTDEDPEGEAVKELNEAAQELDEQLQFVLEAKMEQFEYTVEKAMEETVRVKENLVSLMGGQAGTGDAELKKIPLRDQLAIAEKVALDPQMQKIAEWAGRFKQIAQDKQQKDYTEAMERRGVTLGNDLERLLPAELGLYTHPTAKKEFLRRFAEGETMQFDQKKRNDMGKGPIVFCLDQSDSMRRLENQSKGFVLALLSIAKKQRRNLCVVLFSTETLLFEYNKGNMTAAELDRLVQTYLGGGTDFSTALQEALQVINQSKFRQADLLFVTDGEDQVCDSFLEEFHERKREKQFQVLSLVIGDETAATETFSDRVLHVTDFDDAGSFTAFEL